jgi:dCMP deaminase
MMDRQLKWDLRFLRMAREVASWSKDPSTKVGSVLVSPDKKTVFHGYNGFPQRMDDKGEWLNDKTEKYSRVIHGEVNAVLNAGKSVEGFTCYTWPFLSCDRCAVFMVQAGITRFVAPKIDADREARWGDALVKTRTYFQQCKCWYSEIDFPTEFESNDYIFGEPD